MARKKPVPPPDLRSAILETSLELIEKNGIHGLSMREVARKLGVTHQAPYHHFEGRGAILHAIVEDGFAKLGAALRSVLRPDAPALENYAATGHAYVRFALANPSHFRLMFRPDLIPEKMRNAGTGEDAFSVLVECVQALQGEGHVPPGDPMPMVLLSWSAVHGIASLTLDRPEQSLPGLPREDAVIDALVSLLRRPLGVERR